MHVSGNVLSGRWDEVPHAGPSDAGPFQFTMSADGKSFSGTWGYDADTTPTPRPWGGTCTGGACLSTSCSFAPSALTARASQATPECKTDENKKEWTDLSIEHDERAAELCIFAAGFAGWALVPGWQVHAGGAAVFASFLCAVEWKLSAMYARWANDPPDPNFTTVALPDTINVPRIKPSKGISKNAAGALNALLRNLARPGELHGGPDPRLRAQPGRGPGRQQGLRGRAAHRGIALRPTARASGHWSTWGLSAVSVARRSQAAKA